MITIQLTQDMTRPGTSQVWKKGSILTLPDPLAHIGETAIKEGKAVRYSLPDRARQQIEGALAKSCCGN